MKITIGNWSWECDGDTLLAGFSITCIVTVIVIFFVIGDRYYKKTPEPTPAPVYYQPPAKRTGNSEEGCRCMGIWGRCDCMKYYGWWCPCPD